MLARTRRASPLVALLLLAACASAPRKPAGQIAEVGLKLATGIGAAQDAIHAVGMASTNAEIRETAAKAIENLDKANQAGLQLTPILKALDAATSPAEIATGVSQAKAILDSLSPLVAAALGPLGQRPEFAQGIKLTSAALQLIATVQFELGQKASVQ